MRLSHNEGLSHDCNKLCDVDVTTVAAYRYKVNAKMPLLVTSKNLAFKISPDKKYIISMHFPKKARQ